MITAEDQKPVFMESDHDKIVDVYFLFYVKILNRQVLSTKILCDGPYLRHLHRLR